MAVPTTMRELPYQTYERVTGKKWLGGNNPQVISELQRFGIAAPPGTSQANLALQTALLNQGAPKPAAPQPAMQPAAQLPAPVVNQLAPPTQPNVSAAPTVEESDSEFDQIFNEPTDQERAAKTFQDRYGIDVSKLDFFAPQKTVKELTNEIIGQTGLLDSRSRIESVTKEIESLENERNQKISEINENPWLTEGVRKGKVDKENEKYEARINARVNRLRLEESLLDDAREETRFAVQTALNVAQQERAFKMDTFKEFLNQVEEEAKARREIQKEQAAAGKPLEISAGASLYDPKTGKFIATAPKEEKPLSISEKYGTGVLGEYNFYAEQEKNSGRKPLSFNDYQTLDANRKAKVVRAGVSSPNNPLLGAVLANPELFSQLTPTQKASLAPALAAAGFTAFGKPLSDTAIKEITMSETALEGLQDLKDKIAVNEKYIGPLSGLSAINPYSKAREVQADINRVRQRVGKALEGGVLRKEDEEKYKKILATITDTPDTALYKVNQLLIDVQRDIDIYKRNQGAAGRNVNSPTAKNDPLGIR